VPGMRVLLCSDGITRYYSDTELQSLSQPHTTPHTVQSLVHGAYLRGGADNISAVMIEVADKISDDASLRAHVAGLRPFLTLPEELSNVHPLFPPYMKPYSVGETAGTIIDQTNGQQRKSYLRTSELPNVTVSVPMPMAPSQPLTTIPTRRPRFWDWIARRPADPAPLVPPSPARTNLDEVSVRGLRDRDED
jgi:hypothetical protein